MKQISEKKFIKTKSILKCYRLSKSFRLNLNLIKHNIYLAKIMIKVKNLSYAYPKSKEKVLKNLSFEINQGEIFGFLGPSGAGKSTTQKVLYKILHDYTGEIRLTEKPSVLKNEYGKHTVKVELQNGQTAEFPVKALGNNPNFLDFINQKSKAGIFGFIS
jgi:ABC-type oligopeptide transport system ATPase subunit